METVTVLLIIAAFTAHFTVTDSMLLLIFSARRSRVPAVGAGSGICSNELSPGVAPMAGARHLVVVPLVGLVELLVVHHNPHLLMLRLVVIVKLVMMMNLVVISREVLFEVCRS